MIGVVIRLLNRNYLVLVLGFNNWGLMCGCWQWLGKDVPVVLPSCAVTKSRCDFHQLVLIRQDSNHK